MNCTDAVSPAIVGEELKKGKVTGCAGLTENIMKGRDMNGSTAVDLRKTLHGLTRAQGKSDKRR